jgi:pectinesterase
MMVWIAALAIGRAAMAADYFVDPNYSGAAGTSNTFNSLADAIAAAPAGESAEKPTRVFLKPGKYKQQLTIAQDNLDLIGGSDNPADTVITDDLNARTPKPVGTGTYGTTGASSTFIKANRIAVTNITFENSTPFGGSQAVAIKTVGDEISFKNCAFVSFQDTLYVTSGRDYFVDCQISGSVDFIFGNATALFDHCTITSRSGGAVTAPNTKPGTAVGMVFLDCTLVKGDEAKDGSVSLGRPWQYGTNDCASVFIRTKIGSHVQAGGWNPWDAKNANPAGDSRFAEFASTDSDGKPLDLSGRVAWSHQLTADQAAQFTAANVLGPADYWWKAGWPAIWGTRNSPPPAYVDWKLGGTWDPAAQLNTAKAN